MRTYSRPAILSFLFLIAIIAHAQGPKVSWAREMDKKTDGEFRMVMDAEDDGSYIWVQRDDEPLIGRLDENMDLSYLKEFDEGMTEAHRNLLRVIPVDERFIVLTTKQNKKSDANELYARCYAKADYKPLGPLKMITSYHIYNHYEMGRYEVALTKDKQKLRVDALAPGKGGGLIPTTLYTDLDLNTAPDPKVLEVDTPDPATPDDMIRVDKFRLLNGHMLYVMQRNKPLDKKHRDDEPEHTFELLEYEGSQMVSDIPIVVPGKYLENVTCAEDGNGDLLCAGFYGMQGSSTIQGGYYLRLDGRTGSVRKESHQDFSDEMMKSGLSDDEADRSSKKAERKDADLALPVYQLGQLRAREDGSHVLIAEQTCTWEYTGSTISDHTLYNDIIVMDMGNDDQIKWIVKVPKRQHLMNDQGVHGSYAVQFGDKNIYLLFNDDKANVPLDPSRKMATYGPKSTNAVVVL
ncbi:MAG: hypothetical protein ABI373_02865, partial [Flavobacteriales bacterium]